MDAEFHPLKEPLGLPPQKFTVFGLVKEENSQEEQVCFEQFKQAKYVTIFITVMALILISFSI